jgi:hypothetical protein
MLRLRPSELTLTPEDVDEAFRRIANRQALRDSRHVSAQSGRPVLRRGPRRAVQDAITTLGDIPILRPRPQRATQSSVDEEMQEESEQTTPSPRARTGRVSASVSPTHGEWTYPANPSTSVSSAPCILHLPLRLRRGHEETPDQSSLVEHRFEEDTTSPALAESSSVESSHDAAGQAAPSQQALPTRPGSTSSQVELRGGGPPKSDHTATSSQDITPTLSTSRRVGPVKSSHDEDSAQENVKAVATANETPPMLRLKSYITKEPKKGDDRPAFSFYDLDLPLRGTQTEPRRASGRLPGLVRSSSSSGAFTHFLNPQRREQPTTSSDDVFSAPVGPLVGPRMGHPQPGGHSRQRPPSRTTPRQFSSETSAASEPFSFYELPPPSRQTSEDQSGSTEPLHAQYDGSASLRDISRGAYHAVRSSDIQAHNNQMHMNIGPSTAGQHGFSPLPSMPYTRGLNSYTVPQAMSGGYIVTPAPTGYVDAATEAMQGLPSPLGAYSEHYQRLMQQQNARQIMHAYPTAQHPTSQYSAGARHSSAEFARRMNDRLPLQYSTLYTLPQFYGAPERPPQLMGRNVHATRTNQRSSENAPVRPPAQGRVPSRNSVVQRNRAAFEAMHNLGNTEPRASRLSVPQPALPRDLSNQYWGQELSRTSTSRQQMRHPTPHTSSSPRPPLVQPTTQLRPATQRTSPAIPPTIPPPIPPRNGSNIRLGGGAPDRSQTRARHRITPARSPTYPQPSHPGPTTSLAPYHVSATTRLRSPLLRTTTSARPPPRVRAQQRDQENSGAGEEQLMRQEAAAIQARYGEEDEERDIMDETPPRVGRVERRMFS